MKTNKKQKIRKRDLFLFRHGESTNNRIQQTLGNPAFVQVEPQCPTTGNGNRRKEIAKLNPFVASVQDEQIREQILSLLDEEQSVISEMGVIFDPPLTTRGTFQARSLLNHPGLQKSFPRISFYGKQNKILILISPTLRTLQTAEHFVALLKEKFPMLQNPYVIPILCEKGGGYVPPSKSNFQTQKQQLQKYSYLSIPSIEEKFKNYTTAPCYTDSKKSKLQTHWWNARYNTIEKKTVKNKNPLQGDEALQIPQQQENFEHTNSKESQKKEIEIEKAYFKRVYAVKQWLLSVITDFQHSYDMIFVFAHGDILSCLLSQLLFGSTTEHNKMESHSKDLIFQISNAGVSHLEFHFSEPFVSLSKSDCNTLNERNSGNNDSDSTSSNLLLLFEQKKKMQKEIKEKKQKETEKQIEGKSEMLIQQEDKLLNSFQAPPQVSQVYELSFEQLKQIWNVKENFKICAKGIAVSHYI